MRYYYEIMEEKGLYFKVSSCKSPICRHYSYIEDGEIGLGIIQLHFDPIQKVYWWGPVDACVLNDIYEHENFEDYFENQAGLKENGSYPIAKVRSVMWALRMKPLPREYWEKEL